jgi:hypothetical protein
MTPSPSSTDGLKADGVCKWGFRAHRQSPPSRFRPTASKVRHLPSTGITRFPRYYEPLRHPIRPSLSLTSCRLVLCYHRRGFPCCVCSPVCACCRHYPGRTAGSCSLVLSQQLRPSPRGRQVGSCIARFEAYSTFILVTACTLTESLNDPFHRRLQRFRCLYRRFGCYRVERTSSRAGLSPAEKHHLSTAHSLHYAALGRRTRVFIPLGGPQAHDLFGRDDKFVAQRSYRAKLLISNKFVIPTEA